MFSGYYTKLKKLRKQIGRKKKIKTSEERRSGFERDVK